MKIEIIKTYILFILVGLSIILTYNIWTYQPNFDIYDDKGETYVPEADFYLGGKRVTLHDVVIPTRILFHDNGKYFGFTEANDRVRLFKDMQTWSLNNFSISKFTGIPDDSQQVEIRFPTSLPLEMVTHFFTLNEKTKNMPSWSFDRVVVTFDDNQSTLQLHVPSIDGKQQAVATIQQQEKFTLLKKYINNKEKLEELIVFQEAGDKPIYLEKQPVQKLKRSLSLDVEELNQAPSRLVNALFSDPSVVTKNISKQNISNYTDGRQQMEVGPYRISMEFTNPSQVDRDDSMRPIDLIEKSIENINEHKGWTEHFHLDSVHMDEQEITFLMYHNGDPILGGNESKMVQAWNKEKLFKYKRPLFQFSDKIDDEMVELPNGNDVIRFLVNESTYELNDIDDIRIGFDLGYRDISSYFIVLEPAWFINYKGSWVKLNMNEDAKEVS